MKKVLIPLLILTNINFVFALERYSKEQFLIAAAIATTKKNFEIAIQKETKFYKSHKIVDVEFPYQGSDECKITVSFNESSLEALSVIFGCD